MAGRGYIGKKAFVALIGTAFVLFGVLVAWADWNTYSGGVAIGIVLLVVGLTLIYLSYKWLKEGKA